jgi:hypothetical protein
VYSLLIYHFININGEANYRHHTRPQGYKDEQELVLVQKRMLREVMTIVGGMCLSWKMDNKTGFMKA